MVAYGVQLTTEQESAIEYACSSDKFLTADVVKAAVKVGVPLKGRGEHFNRNPAKQAATQIIQRMKKASRIRQLREGVWVRQEQQMAA